MTDWLKEAIEADATILTANHRLAATLTREVNDLQLQAGKLAWRPLEIREWRSYLTGLYQSAAVEQDLPLRLSSRQSLLLWEDALRPDLDDGGENLPALARLARDTRDALVDHGVEPDQVSTSAATDDQRIFSQSLKRYLARLENNAWIDDAGVRAYVVDNADAFAWPGNAVFAGFVEQSPLLQALQQSLEAAGTQCRTSTVTSRGAAERASFKDRRAELRAAGQWARAQREHGKRVAIVVSGLESAATETGALVREGFTPGWQFDRQASGSVNVSFGRRLSEYPMVSLALSALRLLFTSAGSAEISVLLRTDMLGDHRDNSRFKAAAALHDVPDRDWTPGLLEAWQSPADGSSLERLLAILKQQAEVHANDRRSPGSWAEAFDNALDGLGWPGADALNSEEFQLQNRWRELLEEFSSLSTVAGRLSGQQALARLGLLASDTVFQPEQLDSAVDVLGPMEAAGQAFDAVWIAGLTDTEWPGAARPSPLLSLRLQREAGMRDSSPERRLEHQFALLGQLVAAAPQVVFSYPELDGDAETSVSPLLDEFSPQEVTFEDPGWFVETLIEPDALEHLVERAPPVEPGERIYGGASVPELQHGSPFDAFVAGRLAIDNPEPFSRAVGARIRGILTHDALCCFYDELGGNTALEALDEDTLSERIRSSIGEESKAWFVGVDETLRRLLKLEEQRLEGVLLDVVNVDRTRGQFEVLAREEQAALQHGPVRLRFRIDRIDRLSDGALLLLDYKTGKPSGFVRQDGGPRSFQLVVYSMCFDEPIAGLGQYFASAKETVIKGIGRDLGRENQFDDKLREWRGEVRRLLDDFAAGDLRIVAQRPLSEGADSLLLSRLPELKRYA